MINRIIARYPILRETFLYAIIGGFSAFTDSCFYYLFTRWFLLSELFSNFLSVNIGIAISFLLNTFVNFRKTSNLHKRAMSFYLVGYMGLGLSTLLLFVGINYLDINDLIVKFVSIFVVAAFQFILNKTITYGKI
jgi:putative flippase GtrA